MLGQRVDTPGFFIAVDQYLIRCFHKENFIGNTLLFQFLQRLGHRIKKLAAPDVGNQCNVTNPFASLDAQFREFRNQYRRQVINTEISHIFQHFHGLALAST